MRSNGMQRGRPWAALVLAAVAMGAAAATHTVAIDGTAFVPATLTVQRGDRITWTNRDPFPHTATAQGRAFDSGSIAAGRTWSWVARTPGTYDYLCTLHPGMTGRVIVQ